ncbi:MAG: TlpA family protein disulfide reductase [Saprospirales bacterium]|nr:TlpA family protein disulfide reductase [Saprospirales bacterium]MBK8922629.1 TlpA family protein disulfide reductase [Saprospirales bacterium]
MKFNYVKIGLVLLGIFGAFLWYRYRQPRFIAGEKVPEFEAVLANGQTARFSDLRGQYVLLQFWGSWCGPCRAENPQLARLYHQYHAQGFEIFSVAIEQNPSAWKRALMADGMVWNYHTAEFDRFSGPLATLFNIHAIPSTFLVNPEGVIMGVNLPAEQLGRMLQSGLAGR